MDQTILSHYKINTLNPNVWPEDLDSDDSDAEQVIIPGLNKRKSKSRYSALNRNATLRASIPGAERSKAGVENLVQKDEIDPLGGPKTVIQVLRQRGVPVEDDSRLRVLQYLFLLNFCHMSDF
jgi:exocyst complex component 2